VSFQVRFVGAIAAAHLLALGGAFLGVGRLVNAAQERQFDDALRREAREEIGEIAAGGASRLRISPRLGPSPDDVGPLTKYAVLYDPDGEVLDATPAWEAQVPALPDLHDADIDDLELAGQRLRGLVAQIPGYPGVTLLLAAPRTDLDADAQYLSRAMLAVFCLSLLATALLSLVVVRRLTHVHARIAQVARRVSNRDLSARVGPVDGAPEIVQLAADVDAMIGRLESLLQRQSEFITHAAHELRSPLTTLYGELSYATRHERDAHSYREAITDALDSTRRLMALADDLLLLARAERGPAPTHDPVELAQVCAQAVALVRAEAAASQVRVEVDVEPLTLQGDPLALVRLIRNLVENAVGHAPPGSTVELRGRRSGQRARVRVRDYGRGVAAEDVDQIFQPFFRGRQERASDRPGTGLGLAIADEIARRHGGSITLRTDEAVDPGACFEIDLPLAASPGRGPN
jgi:signal transduction histidine kinase